MSSLFDNGPGYAKAKALHKKLNAGTGRRLTSKEQREKSKDYPASNHKSITSSDKTHYRGHRISGI